MKVLSPTQSRDPAAVRRFENEARAAARLDHDHIARVFYIGEDKGLHFIAFEFVTGTNVRDLILQRGRFEPEEVVNYALQIASALRHTAAAGVVHRDIKPSNIIFTPSGRAKLVDLGLARKEHSETSQDLTVAGTTLGTFDYISPEQAKDPRDVDVRSDIYSLGCTLYHMLTREPPYPEGTVLQKLLDHQGKEAPDPALKNPRISPDLSAIVQKMMASDPDHRYPNPDQLIHDLMLVAGSMGLRGVSPEGPIWMSPKAPGTRFWERHVGWMVTAVLLVVIVVVLEQYGRQLDKILGLRPVAQLTPTDTVAPVPASDVGVGVPNAIPPNEDDSATESPTNSLTAATDTPQIPPDQQRPAAAGAMASAEPLLTSGDTGKSDEADDDPGLPTKPPSIAQGTNDAAVQTPKTLVDGQPAVEGSADPDAMSATSPMDEVADIPTTAAPVVPPDASSPYTVVAGDETPGKSYSTLEAACSEAADGSRIELRFNGVRRETPIRISNKTLTLRAAAEYQPVIEFVPTESPGEGVQTHMITVTDGSVHLVDLHLLMRIPSQMRADQFALFSLENAEKMRLQSVTATIENRADCPAAFAELTPGASQILADLPMMPGEFRQAPGEIEIVGSILRGGSDLFLIAQNAPTQFAIRDSAIALDGSLLHIRGAEDTGVGDGQLRLQLEHVTCLLGGSLVNVDTGQLPRNVLPISVDSRNNVYAVPSDGALIAMSGATTDEAFRKMLEWKGERNSYDRCQVFWRLTADAKPLDFDGWKLAWGPANEVAPNNDSVPWAQPWRYLRFSELTAADFTLDQSVSQPGVSDATGESQAGTAPSQLPVIPKITTDEPE